MNEKVIEIVKIDPRELFDPSGVNFETLSRLCPKLKLVVRGSKIKALGAEAGSSTTCMGRVSFI